MNGQFYHYPYYNIHNIPISREPESSVFEKTYYQRELNSSEIDFFKNKEHDKIAAEKVTNVIIIKLQKILEEVRLTYYYEDSENLVDTITVTEDLVQDADLFFSLMAKATNSFAFSSSCCLTFDSKH